MKLAVSSAGTTLESNVDPRFGRCPYFIYVDSDTLQFEAVENPGATAGGGAGIATAQAVAAEGAGVVIDGQLQVPTPMRY
jgi:predicted Fe-Mo cluster-binding NifX family protein